MALHRVRLLTTVGFTALLAVTVVVFLSIDRGSHSVSDTLRPFLLIMGPAWVIAIAAARHLLRSNPDNRASAGGSTIP